MYKLKQTIADIKPYEPVTGTYDIRLDANESFRRVSNEIISDAIRNVSINRYPDPAASELIRAFSDFYGISEHNVTAANGSDELLYLIISAFLPHKGNLIRLEHDFSMYTFYAEVAEKTVHTLPKNASLEISADSVISYVNRLNNTSTDNILIFSNPCNPTSIGLDKADVIRIIENVNALVVLDEAYMDFWDGNQSLIRIAHEYENLILLRTASKAVAAAGLRLGFAVAGTRLTAALRAAKSPYNVNSISQAVGSAIYRDKTAALAAIDEVKSELRFLYGEVAARNFPFFEHIYPAAANFIFIKSERAHEIYEYLKQCGIIVRKTGGYLRITAGSRTENETLIEKLIYFNQNDFDCRNKNTKCV